MEKEDVEVLSVDIASLEQRAHVMRRHILHMAEIVGQGYVGQGLGIADLLAVLYFGEMRYDPTNLKWPDRDRFLLDRTLFDRALCRPGRGRSDKLRGTGHIRVE